jgi:hypothetical protein
MENSVDPADHIREVKRVAENVLRAAHNIGNLPRETMAQAAKAVGFAGAAENAHHAGEHPATVMQWLQPAVDACNGAASSVSRVEGYADKLEAHTELFPGILSDVADAAGTGTVQETADKYTAAINGKR